MMQHGLLVAMGLVRDPAIVAKLLLSLRTPTKISAEELIMRQP